MKYFHPILACVALVACLFHAERTFAQQRWEATYQPGTYSDDLARIVQTANGEYLAYLISKETSTSPEFRYVGRIATNGEMIDLDTSVQSYAGYPYPHLFPLANGSTRVIAFWENGGQAELAKARFTPGFQHVWEGSLDVPFAGVPVMVDDSTFVVARREATAAKFRIMKITLSGNVLWESQTIFATGNTNFAEYHNLSVNLCEDGGFFLGAFFYSFQQNATFLATAKFSADGALLWDNWEQLVGSVSRSASVAGAHFVLSYQNLRKYSTSTGDLLWSKPIGSMLGGGSANAFVGVDLAPTPDGNGFILSGRTTSSVGTANIFLAKFNLDGDLLWKEIYGYDNFGEDVFLVKTTADHGYLVAGKRFLPNGSDAYVIKTDSTGSNYSNLIRGKIYEDLDDDCLIDPGEPGLPNKLLRVVFESGEHYRSTDSTGSYAFPVGEGQSLVQISLFNDPFALPCDATSFNVTLGLNDTVDFDAPIGYLECPLMQVDLAAGIMRPCSTFQYFIHYCNLGTAVAQNAKVRLYLDVQLEFEDAELPFSNPETQLYVFEIGDVQPGECGYFWVQYKVKCNVELGSVLCSTVIIEPDTFCIFVPEFANDPPTQERTCTQVQGSYDPNDKLPLFGTPEFIGLDSTLKYQIRFQNTGTDLAYNVFILDTLSPNLEPLSIQPLAASHPYRWELGDFGVVKFIFENILLPDSTSDEPGSHGFVQFKIRQRPGLARNTQIKNRAGIYFDFNLPVMTNTVNQKVKYPERPRHDSLTLCAGDFFNNHAQFGDTTYVQTLLYPTFDSVIYSHLKVLPTFENWVDTLVPPGTFIAGLPIFQTENFDLQLFASNGCDSTVHLQVAPLPGSPVAGLLAGDDEVCQFETASYALPFHPSATYVWSATGGEIVAGQGTNQVFVNWQSPLPGEVACQIFIGGDTLAVEPLPVNVFAHELSATAAVADPNCHAAADGSIDLNVIGAGLPFSFLWSNGAISEDLADLPAGAYSVVVTNIFGCTVAQNFTLAEPPTLEFSATWNNPPSGQPNGGSVSLDVTGGTPPYFFAWNNGATTDSLASLAAGIYAFTVTDSHGCTANGSVILQEETAAAEVPRKYGLAVSPNPASEELQVKFNLPATQSVRLEVLNALGRRVAILTENETLAAGEHRLKVQVGEWAAGLYLLNFQAGEESVSLRFLKK